MDLQELHKSLADLSHTIYCTCECVHHGMNIYVFFIEQSIYICYSLGLQRAYILYVIYAITNAVQQEKCSSFFLHTLVNMVAE